MSSKSNLKYKIMESIKLVSYRLEFKLIKYIEYLNRYK